MVPGHETTKQVLLYVE